MPADFEQEALNAQAMVARSYALYQITNSPENPEHLGAHVCDSHLCCQAWISKEDRLSKWEEENREVFWNKVCTAVANTSGKIITYQGKVIDAFFHSNSGGTTEIPINVWGGTNYPYLQAVATSGEEGYSQYASNAEFTKTEAEQKVRAAHANLEINWNDAESVKVQELTEGGRVKTLKFGNVNLSGVEARTIFGLRSANFNFTISEENVIFDVVGYGHGVGMSQTGANTLAKEGKTYEEIVHYYYKDVEIKEFV